MAQSGRWQAPQDEAIFWSRGAINWQLLLPYLRALPFLELLLLLRLLRLLFMQTMGLLLLEQLL